MSVFNRTARPLAGTPRSAMEQPVVHVDRGAITMKTTNLTRGVEDTGGQAFRKSGAKVLPKEVLLKEVFYETPPPKTFYSTLGDDMAFVLTVSLFHKAYDSGDGEKLSKFRVDISGLTGGLHAKRLLGILGSHFLERTNNFVYTECNGDTCLPPTSPLKPISSSVYYICTASHMSFYRIEGSVEKTWSDKGDDAFRSELLSKVLLGTPEKPAVKSTEDSPDVFKMPLEYEGTLHSNWAWLPGEGKCAKIKAVKEY